LLKPACAQAVRQISNKVTVKEFEEQSCVCVCVCVKFCCKLGKNFTETFQLLNQAYDEDYEWVFLTQKNVDESVQDQGDVGFVF
jgi:hypothetical protein